MSKRQKIIVGAVSGIAIALFLYVGILAFNMWYYDWAYQRIKPGMTRGQVRHELMLFSERKGPLGFSRPDMRGDPHHTVCMYDLRSEPWATIIVTYDANGRVVNAIASD